MATYDELDAEAGVTPANNYASLDAEAGIQRPRNVVAEGIKQKKSELNEIYTNVRDQMSGPASREQEALNRLLRFAGTPDEEAMGIARSLTSDRLATQVKQAQMPLGKRDRGLDVKVALHDIYAGEGDDDQKRSDAQGLIYDELQQYAGRIQSEVQAGYDWKRWDEAAQELKGKFLKKLGRRWERGSKMVVGGGLHFMDQLQQVSHEVAKATGYDPAIQATGDLQQGLEHWARTFHEVLNQPELQPVIENVFDKYGGGAVESAPFILSTVAPALLTGGQTAIPQISGFLTAYAVEGNEVYQSWLDKHPNDRRGAQARGIAAGLINGGIEMVGGSGTKYLDNAVANVAGRFGRLRNFGRNTMRKALAEGLKEELPQEMVSMALGGDIPRHEDGGVDWLVLADRLLDTAIAGTITGGLIEAPFAARHAIRLPRTVDAAVQEVQQNQDAEIEAAAEVDPTSPTTKVPGIADPELTRGAERKGYQGGEFEIADKGDVVRNKDLGPEAAKQTQLGPDPKEITDLAEQYVQDGMDPDKALAWAQKTLEPQALGHPGEDPEAVISVRHPQRKLVDVPLTQPPPVQITDAEVAENLAQEFGITGQEALELLQEHRKTDGPMTEAQRLAAQLQIRDKLSKQGTPTERLNRRGVYRMLDTTKKFGEWFQLSFSRVERWLEALDGHQPNGPIRNAVWGRLRPASLVRKQAIFEATQQFTNHLNQMGIDVNRWMTKVEAIAPGIKLTQAQQVGVAMLAQNKHGKRYLTKGMKIPPQVIGAIINHLSPDQKAVMQWMQNEYQRQWNEIYDAAIAAGINPDQLQQEKDYFPLMILDKSIAGQQQDILSLLTNQFEGRPTPDRGIIQQRQESTAGEIELDAFVAFLNHISKAEGFKAMAPAASQVAKVTMDPEFRKALNRSTYGQGTDILDRFVRHTVRGVTSDKLSRYEHYARNVRRNVKSYLLMFKVLTGFRQGISTLNGLSADPKVSAEYAKVVGTMAGNWKAYQEMKEFAEENSQDVKHRAWDRDIKRHYTGEDARSFLLGTQRIDKRGMWLARKIDKGTVVVVWTSLYNHAKHNENMSHEDAVAYADQWIGRTQPMGDPEHLPDFFRGGEIAKALTDFQQMPNQTWNTLAHDVVGARKAGKIGNLTAAYRVMMSVVLPAFVMGAIGRGRLPKEPKELLADLLLYPLGIVPVAGRWAERALRGWGTGGSLAETPFEEAIKLGREIEQGDLPGIAKRTATTVGSVTGKIPHQLITTTEGAHDLFKGNTDDPRRLIWSKYQLGEDDKKKRMRKRPRRKR